MATIDPDVFYSFPASGLPGFKKIAQLSLACRVYPPGLPTTHFRRSFESDWAFRRERESLDAAPNESAAIRQEGESRLQRFKEHIKASANTEPKAGPDTSEIPLACEVKRFRVDFEHRAEPAASVTCAVAEYFDVSCPCTNFVCYPPSAFMSWHTNRYDIPGWRMYIVGVTEPERSFFRYVHPDTGGLHTVWDYATATVNFFKIGKHRLFWHCVASDSTHRWSLGYAVPNSWRERLL